MNFTRKRKYMFGAAFFAGIAGLLLIRPAISWKTPLVKIELMPYDKAFRRAIVANAKSLVGVSPRSETRLIFEKILGDPGKNGWPLDVPFHARKIDGKWRVKGISTCGLVGEGIQRRMGSRCDALYGPYISGTSISRMISCAMEWGAWRGPTYRPRPGDYVVVGSGLLTHVITVIGYSGKNIISVDGGRVGSDGLQCIKRVVRPYRPGKIGTRDIYGTFDVTAGKYSGYALVPKGGWK